MENKQINLVYNEKTEQIQLNSPPVWLVLTNIFSAGVPVILFTFVRQQVNLKGVNQAINSSSMFHTLESLSDFSVCCAVLNTE